MSVQSMVKDTTDDEGFLLLLFIVFGIAAYQHHRMSQIQPIPIQAPLLPPSADSGI